MQYCCLSWCCFYTLHCYVKISNSYNAYISNRGGFEIWKNGIFLKPCDGIQAHLSTLACSKVIDVVTKLPQKILVEEVPRLSIWPTQVPVDYTTEENICLYFFAEGFERFVWVVFYIL